MYQQLSIERFKESTSYSYLTVTRSKHRSLNWSSRIIRMIGPLHLVLVILKLSFVVLFCYSPICHLTLFCCSAWVRLLLSITSKNQYTNLVSCLIRHLSTSFPNILFVVPQHSSAPEPFCQLSCTQTMFIIFYTRRLIQLFPYVERHIFSCQLCLQNLYLNFLQRVYLGHK